MGVDLNRMAVFVAVVEHRSFTAAAQALGMTKSMVSQHVRQLETSLGVTLLQRTTRSMSLTEAGEIYHATASRVLRDAEQVHAQLQSFKRAPSGVLRVTAPLDLAVTTLVPAATEFMRRYPRVQIDLVTSDEILDMVEQRLDMAIRVGWLADSSRHAVPLGGFAQLLCGSPAYLARAPAPVVPADLANLDWVAHAALPSPNRCTFRDAQGNEQTVSMRRRVVANHGVAVRAFVLAGAGIGSLPDYQAREDLQAGRLVRVLPSHTLPQGGIFAVVPSRRDAPAKVSEFLRFLKAELGDRARR
ncbi:LysR family transcriptional regulator [Sorangium sp. So ce394]|uniref:LysR family transcriptional regulator n=1 Tax=Sorangium sp. So ce394 TaxID=3133310 RepID=UPI003F5C855A